jgi:ubiquinone/menaquinone biosynthesis C-methylase UbiE
MAREDFDGIARDYDDQDKVQRARDVADAIRGGVPLTGRERVLEYGAGTGLVSQALQEAVGPLTLVDTSSGMRQVAEQKVTDGALPSSTRVWDLDLTDPEAKLPEEAFDLVVSSLVLHHITDLTPVLAGLHRLLVPGGHLAVADLDSEDGRFHAHLHDFDGHDGFDRHQLARALGTAGFTDVTVDDCTTVVKHGEVFPVFLAVGRR